MWFYFISASKYDSKQTTVRLKEKFFFFFNRKLQVGSGRPKQKQTEDTGPLPQQLFSPFVFSLNDTAAEFSTERQKEGKASCCVLRFLDFVRFFLSTVLRFKFQVRPSDLFLSKIVSDSRRFPIFSCTFKLLCSYSLG